MVLIILLTSFPDMGLVFLLEALFLLAGVPVLVPLGEPREIIPSVGTAWFFQLAGFKMAASSTSTSVVVGKVERWVKVGKGELELVVNRIVDMNSRMSTTHHIFIMVIFVGAFLRRNEGR